jgi:putative membrane protein
MIDYNPKDWFTFIFRVHQADTFRKLLPMIAAICAYSGLVAWLVFAVWKLPGDSHVKNISLLHSLLGFVISLLLAFRSNSAYDRWWEGRKLWGSLVNNSRNLALRMNALLPAEDLEGRRFFRAMIPNFAFALKNHLREQFNPDEFVAAGGVEARHLDPARHVPNQVNGHLMNRTYALRRQGVITGEELLSVNAELQSFADICGACERIRNTPIPFSYSAFLKKFIFFYVMTLPFGLVFSLGYYVIPAVGFVFYVLASMELIAEEIENPFGTDANDLPTDGISGNIRRHVEEIL